MSLEDEKLLESERNLGEFIAEAEEIVDNLNNDLLHLASGTKTDPAILNSIFRGSHTLKGLSGMFGYTELTNLSHNMENLLDSLRLGKLKLTRELIDLLFDAVSAMHSLLEAKSTGRPVISVDALIAGLNAAITGKPIMSEGPSSGLKIDKAIMNVLTEYEEHRLLTCIEEGLNIFKVQASFPIMSFDQGLAELTETLKENGEIITTLPTPGMSPGDIIHFDILISTAVDRKIIEESIDNRDITVSMVAGMGGRSAAEEVLTPSLQPAGDAGVRQPEDVKPDEGIKSLSRTVRVDISKLDTLMNIVGELVLQRIAVSAITEEMKAKDGNNLQLKELQKVVRGSEKMLSELQQAVLDARMVPLSQVFDKLVRTIRKIGREMGKEVVVEVRGGSTELDKLIVEELANPLLHLVRNSIDHGIESADERRRKGKDERGLIQLNAYQRGNHVIVEVEDDGRGIDHEKILRKAREKKLVQEGVSIRKEDILDFMFLPGFSTKDTVSEISGRGVGMDVVKRNISDLSGMVQIDTTPGRGTKVIIILPMTLAIIQALILEVADQTYALPINSVLETFILDPSAIETIEKKEFVHLRDITLPLVRIEELFRLGNKGEEKEKYVVVVGLAEKKLGLIVDRLKGQQDIVIKSIGPRFRDVKGVTGATDIGQKTIIVLDVGGIMEVCMRGQVMSGLTVNK